MGLCSPRTKILLDIIAGARIPLTWATGPPSLLLTLAAAQESSTGPSTPEGEWLSVQLVSPLLTCSSGDTGLAGG